MINFKEATLTLFDKNAQSLIVRTGRGNYTFVEKDVVQYETGRGLLSRGLAKPLAGHPVEFTFDAVWETLSGISPNEVFSGSTNWVSTAKDSCEPFAVDLKLDYLKLSGRLETLTLIEFRKESATHVLRDALINFKGSAKQPLTIQITGV